MQRSEAYRADRPQTIRIENISERKVTYKLQDQRERERKGEMSERDGREEGMRKRDKDETPNWLAFVSLILS